MTSERCSGQVLSFLLGAVAGAATALLLSPRSGRETREYIADRGNEVSETVARRAHDLAADVQSRAGTWLDRGRDLLEGETRRLRDAFDAGREAMRDEIRQSGRTPEG
jgi:gas vesicle protein